MPKGFTLIELIVAAAIFILIIGSVFGFFISSVQVQRRTLASQELLNQVSFALDYMSRKIMMARKELNCTDIIDPTTCSQANDSFCLTNAGYGCNYERTRQAGEVYKGIKLINHSGICQEFFLENEQLKKAECFSGSDCSPGGDWGEPLPFTSDNLDIYDFRIELVGECQYQEGGEIDNSQPRATLILKVKNKGQKSESQSELVIQTMLSQRNRDTEQTK